MQSTATVIFAAIPSMFHTITRHKQFPAARQAVKFMMVGVINTLVDIAVYYVLTRYTTFFNDQILLTRVLSFLSGSVCSFILNRIWTFEKRDAVRGGEVLKFYLTVGMSLLIGLASMQFFIKVFHFYDLIALGISIIFTFIWNFTISKFWVFKKYTARK